PRPRQLSTSLPYTTLFRSLVSVPLVDEPVLTQGEAVVAEVQEQRVLPHVVPYEPVQHAPDAVVERERRLGVAAVELVELELPVRSEEHTSELQSRENLVCR